MPTPYNLAYSDPFCVENPDIFQFQYTPPEPYSLVLPGEVIAVGDIKCIAAVDTEEDVVPNIPWADIASSEVGMTVPHKGMIYARVCPPVGYELVPGDEAIEQRAVLWQDTLPTWEPWRGEGEGATAAEIIQNHDGKVFFAKPREQAADCQLLPLPTQHRDLYTGEVIRRGDKRIHQGLDEWQEVADRGLGLEVIATTEENGQVRHCRPCSPSQQVWYVDLREGQGKAAALGGFGDPFDTLANAQKHIDTAATAANTAVHGVIFDRSGAPLLAYDLPEPTVRALPSATPPVAVWDDSPVVPVAPVAQIEADEPPEEEDHVAEVTGDANWIAQEQGVTVAAVKEEAAAALHTNYRQMVAGEESRSTDLWFGPVGEDCSSLLWQPCPQEFCDLNPEVGDYLFARKKAPLITTPAVATQLKSVEAQLQEALGIVQSLLAADTTRGS